MSQVFEATIFLQTFRIDDCARWRDLLSCHNISDQIFDLLSIDRIGNIRDLQYMFWNVSWTQSGLNSTANLPDQ